jgi:hypothetical protein
MRNIFITGLIFLAFSMVAAKDPAVNGPRVTETEFFAALDLERPELAMVKAAVQRKDSGAARHALSEHLRHRQKPGWEFNPLAIKDDPKYHSGTADRALTHKFSSIGIEWQFGEKIDWAFNPTTQPDSRWPRNHEWTWQLSRHSAWLELSRAFYHTGDEKYAREFVAELKSWVRDCPVPLDKADNGAYSRWRTIEAGIRTGSGKVVSAYVLCPARAAGTCPVTGARLMGNELRLTLASGQEKILKLTGKAFPEHPRLNF